MILQRGLLRFTLLYFLVSIVTSCQWSGSNLSNNESQLFNIIAAEESGLTFVNYLEETLEANYYQYLYTYIGGGVAAGDINNDGLIDLYFTSNSAEDKLFLNKGNLVFEDITQSAGIRFNDGFNVGVTMADVNADGYLDIYVSRGGWKDDNDKFNNLLYINNGDLSFSENAKFHGLDDPNRSIQATFFDYDNDNDLDVYVSNTPNVTGRSNVVSLSEIHEDPQTLLLKGSDRLYENDGDGHFTDVSEQAGLLYDIGFGLNPQVADLNADGWLDVYVCNDFNYPDLVYLNNGDKTFTESRDEMFKHMSFNSMGSDVADINNDGLFDLMTLDMNPEDYVRSKTTMTMTSVGRFESMVQHGYHYQYMHNMLQLNNGNGTFSEIANMAGMANTDWSWALLSADFNLDGWNDLYITNGVYRDVLEQDKNIEIRNILRKNGRKPTPEDLLKFTQMLPQQKLRNYFFKNSSELGFEDVSTVWAGEGPTFSNGATYADLDKDGDLDLVVNNINDHVSLLENKASDLQKGNFLKIKLQGPRGNSFGVGAKLKLSFEDGTSQIRHHIPTRGYLSSTSNWIHFGYKGQVPQKLEILWPNGNQQEVKKLQANQQLEISFSDNKYKEPNTDSKSLFSKVGSIHLHEDPYFNDYGLQVLLPQKYSQTGPFASQADVNADGFIDVFIGGGHKQAGQLLLGDELGGFTKISQEAFHKDAIYEDQDGLFFDADNDGDKDLYVVSGSYEFDQNPRILQDRLYINTGNGKFERHRDRLPTINTSGSTVIAADYDKDGDNDLFVGGRVVPGKYPYAPQSYILENQNGYFKDVTAEIAPNLAYLGMISDAVWADVDNNESPDLIVTGEWMGIEVFVNRNGKLEANEEYDFLREMRGWWNKIAIADIDEDGDKDFIAGNLGLNSKFHASEDKPFKIYTDDFDRNGSADILLAKEYKGEEVPVRGKTCMTQQMPFLAERVASYNDFAKLNLEEIVGADLSQSLQYEAVEFRSGIFENEGNSSFSFHPFDMVAQISTVNSIVYEDLDGDQIADLLLAGNNYQTEVETTRSDAGISTFLKGRGNGDFAFIPNIKTGLFLDKDVRDIEVLLLNEAKMLLILNNNDLHDLYIPFNSTK